MDTIQIKVVKIIRAKKWKVLRLISRIEDFPHFMPNVKQCTRLERNHHRAVTAWSVEIDKIPLSWKEEEIYDLDHFTITFKALSGDLEQFEGQWVLKDLPDGGTEVTVTVNLRMGIPLIEKVIGPILGDKVKKNFEAMLAAIDERLSLKRYKNIRYRKISDVKGFAVIGHPYNLQHLIRYFRFFKPDFKPPSEEFLVRVFEMAPAYKSYDIQNFKSKAGKSTHGYFIMCPIIPDMLLLNPDRVVEKVIQACKVAEGLGVGIVTLGGFTSIAGEKYNKPLTSLVNVPVTTGNTFTVALTVEGVIKAAGLMDIDLSKTKVTVIGGTGDIGSACARILAEQVAEVTITARSEKGLMEMDRLLSYSGRAKIKTSCDNNDAVRGADIIIAAASTSNSIIDFNCFKSGAIVCDIGYPKNISYTACDRRDILIFSGGIASMPTEFDLGFDIGMPSPRVLYGCFAEAILLDLEERYENYSWGKGNITNEKVDFIRAIGKKHGFELAPFFWGNRELTEKNIEEIRAERKETLLKSGR